MNAPLETGRIAIRPARQADLEELLEYRLAMLEELSAERAHSPAATDLTEANRTWFADHLGRDFQAWIADVDGTAAASAGLLWFHHPPSPMNPAGLEAYLLNVYTRPEARRRGLARKLVERAVGEARSAGVRRIWLRASSSGRPLYEELGFASGDYLQYVPPDETGPTD